MAVICALGLTLAGPASAAPPAAPVLAFDVNANRSVDLVWTPVAGATQYRIFEYIEDPTNATGDGVATVTDTTSRRGPLAPRDHGYFVKAINAAGELSAESNRVVVPVADDPTANRVDSVTFDTPAEGATISGTAVNFSATCPTPTACAEMNYYVDGLFVADDGVGDNADGFSEPVDTTAFANGKHYVQAGGVKAGTGGQELRTAPRAVTITNDTPPPPPPAACADGLDNDSDGRVDFPADPGCTSATDTSETDPTPPPAVCNDGLDNDVDGRVDFPQDPGCTSATDTDEADAPPPPPPAVCADGVDNDGDAKVDFPADPGCTSSTDTDEADATTPPPGPPVVPPSGPVRAVDETQNSAVASGDSADDPAIWVDPVNPANSVIIGTNKSATAGGLEVYNLAGDRIQRIAQNEVNNVDIRTVGSRVVVTVSERVARTLRYYTLNTTTRQLTAAGTTTLPWEPYGTCMYAAPDGAVYAFVSSRNAPNEFDQYRLTVGTTITGAKVRDMTSGGTSEACVADDERGQVYLGQETGGVLRFNASPTGGTGSTMVHSVGTSGVTAEVEGLAIARGRGATDPDHLVVASQGNSTFQVFDVASGAFVKSFTVIGNSSGTVDAVTGTDGIEITRSNLGPLFPNGLFVAHDTANTGGNVSNFKLVDAGLILGAYGGGTTPPPPPPAPHADFTYSPTSGTAPLTVTFDNTSTGAATSYAWNFGDGATSSAAEPGSHVYANAGTFNVSLTATNAGGSNTITGPVTVTGSTPAADRGPRGAVTIWSDNMDNFDCSIWERVQNQVTSNPGPTDCSRWPNGDGSRLSFPAGSGKDGTAAARIEVRSGDSSAGGERSEISGAGAAWEFHEGDHRWLQQELLLVNPTRDTILTQWHTADNNASPPLELGVEGSGQLTIESHGLGTIPETQVLPASEFKVGVWYDVDIEFIVSHNAAVGGVRVWVDGVAKTPFIKGRTMGAADDPLTYLKMGQYRSPDPDRTTVATRVDNVVLSRN